VSYLFRAIQQKINDNRSKYIEFLTQLISFDTSVIEHGVGGQEGLAQQWLAGYLGKIGCKVDIFEPDNERMSKYPGFNKGHNYKNRPNVVAVYKGTGGGKSLILNGHIDTMPSGDLNKWKTDPWKAQTIDGKIYGLGTDDMKGGLAALVLALELALDMGFRPKGDIIVESVVDEEGGGNGTLACVDRGYKADAAVIAEGSNLEIFAANRGAWLVQADIEGRPIHASLRGFGVNAIEKAVKIIDALRELETKWTTTRKHPLLAPQTINIGYISGGVAASTVPESCTLKFDVEYYPSEIDRFGNKLPVDKDQIVREVENWIFLKCSGDEWLKDHLVKFTWYQDCPPFETDVNHPLIKTLGNICNQTIGKNVLSGMTAGCDARHLTNTAKVPTIVFGPGTCHNAHVVNEYIDIAQYLNAICIYANLIMEWTK
jgi:acetylornithine deacetylase